MRYITSSKVQNTGLGSTNWSSWAKQFLQKYTKRKPFGLLPEELTIDSGKTLRAKNESYKKLIDKIRMWSCGAGVCLRHFMITMLLSFMVANRGQLFVMKWSADPIMPKSRVHSFTDQQQQHRTFPNCWCVWLIVWLKLTYSFLAN